MARLPQPGGDNGTWGDTLNDFLLQVHNANGTLKDNSVSSSVLAPGAVSTSELQDASISEAKLDGAVQTKLNAVSGATNLTATPSASAVVIESSTGTDATISGASGINAGVLTSGDKTKLDGIASGAQVNTVTSVASKTGAVTLDKTDVGLANVDNTSDASKPVSTAQQTALDLKAPLASPAFTGTVTGITKTMVGLGSVDNTTDTAKPVSTAQQTALDAKANTSHSHSGTDITDGTIAETKLDSAAQTKLNTVAPVLSVAGKTGAVTLVKADVGLGSVDNTTDTAKPVSTAQQTALDLKRDEKNQAEVTLTSSTDYIEKFTIVSDGTPTSGWPNRREIKTTPVGGGTPRLVQYENEYGEKRIVARQNTVAWRAFVREFAADTAHTMTVPIWEIQDDRDAGTPLHRMFGDGDFLHTGDGTVGGGLTVTGDIAAANIGEKVVTWPTGSEPSLSGVPDGTLWVEYTP